VPNVPPLAITDEERVELQRRVRAHTTPQRAAKRARIVLLAAEGVPKGSPYSNVSSPARTRAGPSRAPR
jgi:hypothetical protein